MKITKTKILFKIFIKLIQALNGFGVAGISALVGLMTPQITRKLRDVFDQFFGIGKSEAEKGDEPVIYATLKLNAERKKIEVGKESVLIAICAM